MALGWQKDRDSPKGIQKCVPVLNEKGASTNGCLGDRHRGEVFRLENSTICGAIDCVDCPKAGSESSTTNARRHWIGIVLSEYWWISAP
jgi:hypothetical protein